MSDEAEPIDLIAVCKRWAHLRRASGYVPEHLRREWFELLDATDAAIANARLIAAAPDYYAAVEKMLNSLAEFDIVGWQDGLRMLRAAHAKAKRATP